jgi:ribosomal protein L37E
VEPVRSTNATLVDLLDRILDKGLVIYADVIVSVAGIPLIGINLRAALAGMETMVKYGVMVDWDGKSRAWEREHKKKKEVSLIEGEEITQKTFGSYLYTEGIYTAWRSGQLYLTDKRLLVYQKDFDEILFQTPLEKIKGVVMKREKHFTKEQVDVLYLLFPDNQVAQLRAVDICRLKETIEERMKVKGFTLEKNPVLPEFDRRVLKFVRGEEKVTHMSRMWCQPPIQTSGGILNDGWKSGHLYLSEQKLCWYHDFDQRTTVEIPLDKLTEVKIEIRDLGEVLKKKKLLVVSYNGTETCFSCEEEKICQWEKTLNKIISKQSTKVEMETCPQCGEMAPTDELLEKRCAKCGWVSPKLREEAVETVI